MVMVRKGGVGDGARRNRGQPGVECNDVGWVMLRWCYERMVALLECEESWV